MRDILKLQPVHCPICLKKVEEGSPSKGRSVMVCSNEHYEHLIKDGKHILVRTPLNLIENTELSVGSSLRVN